MTSRSGLVLRIVPYYLSYACPLVTQLVYNMLHSIGIGVSKGIGSRTFWGYY